MMHPTGTGFAGGNDEDPNKNPSYQEPKFDDNGRPVEPPLIYDEEGRPVVCDEDGNVITDPAKRKQRMSALRMRKMRQKRKAQQDFRDPESERIRLDIELAKLHLRLTEAEITRDEQEAERQENEMILEVQAQDRETQRQNAGIGSRGNRILDLLEERKARREQKEARAALMETEDEYVLHSFVLRIALF